MNPKNFFLTAKDIATAKRLKQDFLDTIQTYEDGKAYLQALDSDLAVCMHIQYHAVIQQVADVVRTVDDMLAATGSLEQFKHRVVLDRQLAAVQGALGGAIHGRQPFALKPTASSSPKGGW